MHAEAKKLAQIETRWYTIRLVSWTMNRKFRRAREERRGENHSEGRLQPTSCQLARGGAKPALQDRPQERGALCFSG